MKAFYEYLITRPQNPLARKQALIAVAVKLMKVMLAVCKKRESYDCTKAWIVVWGHTPYRECPRIRLKSF